MDIKQFACFEHDSFSTQLGLDGPIWSAAVAFCEKFQVLKHCIDQFNASAPALTVEETGLHI